MYYVGLVSEPAGEKGWLVGAFLDKNHPCFSETIEVGWKKMGPETREPKHTHKKALEIWIIVKGSVAAIIDGQHLVLKAGEYVVVHPFTPTQIMNAKKETIIIVVKSPSIPDDKYPC